LRLKKSLDWLFFLGIWTKKKQTKTGWCDGSKINNPVVNLINILRAAIAPIFLRQKSYKAKLWLEKSCTKQFCSKEGARKMLMKLTPDRMIESKKTYRWNTYLYYHLFQWKPLNLFPDIVTSRLMWSYFKISFIKNSFVVFFDYCYHSVTVITLFRPEKYDLHTISKHAVRICNL